MLYPRLNSTSLLIKKRKHVRKRRIPPAQNTPSPPPDQNTPSPPPAQNTPSPRPAQNTPSPPPDQNTPSPPPDQNTPSDDETPPRRPLIRPPPFPKFLKKNSTRRTALKPFMDAENADLGPKLSLGECLNFMRRNMRRLGLEMTTVEAYATKFPEKFDDVTPEMTLIDYPGIKVRKHLIVKTPVKGRDDADIALVRDILAYALEKEPPISLLVMASDGDYTAVIEELRDLGYQVFQAYSPGGSGEKVKTSEFALKWELYSRGIAPVSVISPAAIDLDSPVVREIREVVAGRHRALVIWDVSSLPFPQDVEPVNFRHNIKSALALGGMGVYKVDAYIDDTLFKSDVKASLNDARGINIQRILRPPAKKKGRSINERRDHIDVKISKVLYNWALTRHPPSPVFLISKDERLANDVATLKRAGFEIYLACDANTCEELKKSASRRVEWTSSRGEGVAKGFWKEI